MPLSAKVYISLVSAAGIAAMACAFFDPPWFSEPGRFAAYFLLSLLAATLKLHLPGLTGTMSIGFVFVLLGIAQLTLPETMLIGCAGAVLQCLWRAHPRPSAVQVLFSVSAVAFSLTIGALGAQFVHGQPVSLVMAVATCLYFVSNSLLVSGVLSLVKRRPLRMVWQQCYLYAFPYYLLGGAVAALMTQSAREAGWGPSLVILPAMGLIFLFYRMYIARMALAAVPQSDPRG